MSKDHNAHGNPRAFTSMKHASQRMDKSLFNRLQATLLALATVGLVALAVLNFRQESKFQQPYDGVWWAETHGGLQATRVLPDSPARSAGIQKGVARNCGGGSGIPRPSR